MVGGLDREDQLDSREQLQQLPRGDMGETPELFAQRTQDISRKNL